MQAIYPVIGTKARVWCAYPKVLVSLLGVKLVDNGPATGLTRFAFHKNVCAHCGKTVCKYNDPK